MYTVLYLLLCYSLSTMCYEPVIETFDLDVYTSVFPTESSTYPPITHSHTSLTTTPSHTTGISVSTTSTGSKYSTTTHSSATPTSTPKSLPFQDLLILYITVPVLGLLVIIAFTIALVLCIRRYRRIRKYRLHLMPLHNMDGSDDEDEDNDDELMEDDQEAAFTISSMGGRQPILQFADSP